MTAIPKSAEEIECMRIAGRLAGEVLDFITPHVRAGVTTGALDALCHDYIVNHQKAIPAPLNYAPPGYKPFPKSICTSLNHQVCHGIPGDRVLKNGDVMNIDVTVIKDGWHGDSSRMYIVGQPSVAARRLCDVAYECMWLGIEQVRPGRHARRHRPGDPAPCGGPRLLGRARILRPRHRPRASTRSRRSCTTAVPARASSCVEGMTFTVEPMINAGRREIRELADGWTIVTKDHSLSAQWEHTVWSPPAATRC